MRRPALSIFAAVCILLMTWLVAAAQQPVEQGRFVLTEREAYLIGNPVLVAAPAVSLARWSPDGRYILAARAEEGPALIHGQAAGEVSLVLWNSRTRRSQVMWKEALPAAGVERVEWLPGTNVALVVVRSAQALGKAVLPRSVLLRVDGARAATRAVSELTHGERLLVSPAKPLAVLCDMDNVLRVVRVDGSTGAVVRLPKGAMTAGWKDGDLVLQSSEAPPPPQKRWVDHWFVLEANSEQVRPVPTRPTQDDPQPASLTVRLRPSATRLQEAATSRGIRPLWLESADRSEEPRALLSADSPWAHLAPDGNAVVYASQGAAWFVPFVRVPREPFLQARRAALRQTAVSNAKQIGTALMMYIQDYDEIFPAPQSVIAGLIPYAGNESLFNTPGTDMPGFVYVHSATPLASIVEPAKTMVGYLPGPDGRALIYADGHVVWADEPVRGP